LIAASRGRAVARAGKGVVAVLAAFIGFVVERAADRVIDRQAILRDQRAP
jgi:hypothetical protein